ncbi:Glycosyltransferase involved in cell wall bisynthesis [Devosia enhydra]|uniref:Glycosyltransferase involved in cell wall bisynthesis n=1 Tax=Devosia enhydra TaxID=665118 RepID=A0A1K2HUP6_9HYPH|nr:glycosyltransferase family 4 protein [Devosia enhydra]SFZ82234.1 Glycosyltransferase involved in cell wall bisynthesis [Devosia enhydra]
MAERPLRILQVLRAPLGGLFRHVNDLTRELSARGHQIGLVVDNLVSDGLTRERLQALGGSTALGIHHFPMPRVIGPGDLTTPFAVRALADRLGAEVMHGHGAKGGVCARIARIGRKNRVALYTTHGGVLNYRPGSMQSRVFLGLEHQLLRFTDGIVFESDFARRTFIERIGQPDCEAPVIHNGLTAHEFDPIVRNPDAADFVFIGEFRGAKGIDVLMRALAPLRAPDGRPATLVAAGDGPMMGEIRQLIASLGLGDRVTLLGVAPARPTLARGRCMVVPSLAESLPYVVLEGASGGLPVISTNVGGISELFGGLSHQLVPPSNDKALGAAMQAYLDDPEPMEAQARAHVDYIKPRFSVCTMTDGIEALYHRALARRQRSIASD